MNNLIALAISIVVFSPLSKAQDRSVFAGIRSAYAYAYGINPNVSPLRVNLGNSSTGVASISLAYGQVTLTDGSIITPLATNAPIRLGNGVNMETVTPTAISCTNPSIYASCSLTANFAYMHGSGELISSATVGLQEALNAAAAAGGGQAAVDAAWYKAGGTAGILAAAVVTSVTAAIDNSGKPVAAVVTGGVPSSGSNTIPFIVPGGTTRATTAGDLTGLIGAAYTTPTQAAAAAPIQSITLNGTPQTPVSGAVSLTVSGGGASLPVSVPVIGSNSSGNGVAATASSITGLFAGTCNGTTLLSGGGTCVTAPAATIPNYTTSGIPATGTAGSLVYATDATTQAPFYFYPSGSSSAVNLLTPGPSGALTYNTANGQVDIVTSVIPRLAANNSFTGTNTVANLTVTGTCTGCAAASGFSNPMTTLGDQIVGGASGAATRAGVGANGTVWTVASGQPAWASPATQLPSVSPATGGDILITTSNATGSNLTVTNTATSKSYDIGQGTDGSMNFVINGNLEALLTAGGVLVSLGNFQTNGDNTSIGGVKINIGNSATDPSCSVAADRNRQWITNPSGTGSGIEDGMKVCHQLANGTLAWKVVY